MFVQPGIEPEPPAQYIGTLPTRLTRWWLIMQLNHPLGSQRQMVHNPETAGEDRELKIFQHKMNPFTTKT